LQAKNSSESLISKKRDSGILTDINRLTKIKKYIFQIVTGSFTAIYKYGHGRET
jgi:hypothetical protein